MKDPVLDFLQQSNFIEQEYDQDSLSQALLAWLYISKQPKLTVKNVLETHRLLMLNQDTITELQKGQFRTVPIAVWEKGVKKDSRSAVGLKHLTEVWIEKMNVEMSNPHLESSYLETLSKQLHVHYEHIHPFADGNGRTGRIFMNWWRVKAGLPILVITEKDKYKYFKWFHK